MRFKRILAAIIALTVALSAVLTMTLVDADTRDSAAGYDKVLEHDYNLEDYEDVISDEVTTESEEAPDPEGTSEESTEESEVTTPGSEEAAPEETAPSLDAPLPQPEPEAGDSGICGDFAYEVLEDGTVSVIGYIGSNEAVVIPGEIEGRTVSAISENALIGCTWIYIPANVSSIGEDALVYSPELTVIGYSATCAESYAEEKEVAFFALGGAVLSDDFSGIEVTLQETDGTDAAYLKVTDGYHAGASTGIYYDISILDSYYSKAQPESDLIVSIPAPYGWKDEIINVYRVDPDGTEYELSSFIYDGRIVFIADELGEFMIAPVDGPEDEVSETTTAEPEITTEPEVTTEPEITTTTPLTTTTPITTTEPVTTTEPATTTTVDTTVPVTEIEPVGDAEPEEDTTAPAETTTPPDSTVTLPQDEAPEEGEEDVTPGSVDLSTSVDVVVDSPIINVTVPSSLNVIINPYGVVVKINDQVYRETGISSPVYTIVNRTTDSNVKITATASLSVPVTERQNEDGTIVSTPAIKVVDTPSEVKNASEKALCAYMLVAASAEQWDQDVNEPPDLFAKGDIAFEEGKTLVFADATLEANENTAPVVVLGPAESDEKFTYAQFKISGNITPNTLGEWTSDDKIELNLVLNITPTDDATVD